MVEISGRYLLAVAATTRLLLLSTYWPTAHIVLTTVLLEAATTRLLLLSTYWPTAHIVLTADLLEAATTRLLLLSTYCSYGPLTNGLLH